MYSAWVKANLKPALYRKVFHPVLVSGKTPVNDIVLSCQYVIDLPQFLLTEIQPRKCRHAVLDLRYPAGTH
jgi:hypothetical protein